MCMNFIRPNRIDLFYEINNNYNPNIWLYVPCCVISATSREQPRPQQQPRRCCWAEIVIFSWFRIKIGTHLISCESICKFNLWLHDRGEPGQYHSMTMGQLQRPDYRFIPNGMILIESTYSTLIARTPAFRFIQIKFLR